MRDRCAMHETNTAWATREMRWRDADRRAENKKESATRSSNMRDKCAMHKTNTAWGSQKSQDFEEHKTSGEQKRSMSHHSMEQPEKINGSAG